MLFFTGFARTASQIAAEQIKATPKKEKELNEMQRMVDDAIDILNSEEDIVRFGELLHRSWQLKRSLSDKISTPYIDYLYDTARNAGAAGGKILGAGGGGFILFFVNPELQSKVTESLPGLLHVPFRFENSGSQIIFYEPDTQYSPAKVEEVLWQK
jgi:D-glycero-alpha-D-manno-heptose-7-phosphate kinase